MQHFARFGSERCTHCPYPGPHFPEAEKRQVWHTFCVNKVSDAKQKTSQRKQIPLEKSKGESPKTKSKRITSKS
jgi:hypothetical protein